VVPIKTPLIVAHRGASGDAPENTLLSIQTGIVSQADIIEFDVQLTKDQEVVLFHDRSLQRITGSSAAIGDMTLAQLQSLDVGTWMHPKFKQTRIPTLQDALHLSNGYPLIVEIKPSANDSGRVLETKVLDLLDDYPALDPGYISVRDEATLQWFKNHDSRHRIALMQKLRPTDEFLAMAKGLDLDIIQIRSALFGENDYAQLSDLRSQCFVFWGDSPQQWQYLCNQPVTGVFTNYPALMRGYLQLQQFSAELQPIEQ